MSFRVIIPPALLDQIECAVSGNRTKAQIAGIVRAVRKSLLDHGRDGQLGREIVLEDPVEANGSVRYHRHTDLTSDFKAYYRHDPVAKTITFVAIRFGTQASIEADHAFVPDDP